MNLRAAKGAGQKPAARLRPGSERKSEGTDGMIPVRAFLSGESKRDEGRKREGLSVRLNSMLVSVVAVVAGEGFLAFSLSHFR